MSLDDNAIHKLTRVSTNANPSGIYKAGRRSLTQVSLGAGGTYVPGDGKEDRSWWYRRSGSRGIYRWKSVS